MLAKKQIRGPSIQEVHESGKLTELVDETIDGI
jgi:hypothetical protein